MEKSKLEKYIAYAVVGLITRGVVAETIPHKPNPSQDPPQNNVILYGTGYPGSVIGMSGTTSFVIAASRPSVELNSTTKLNSHGDSYYSDIRNN